MKKLSFILITVLHLYQIQAYVTGVRKDDSSDSIVRYRRQMNNENKRIICYYAYWSVYRNGPNKFTPEDIDPFLCTHVLYGYSKPDMQEGIVPGDSGFDIQQKGWERFVAVKRSNPELKVMMSIGGLLEGSARFSKIAGDPKLRQNFVKGVSTFLRENGFDGVDMSWLYAGFSEGSTSSDKKNYVSLLKELREELKSEFILSITVPGLKRLLDVGYDIPQIQKYVDFINVWAGSYHESTAPTVNHPSPLYPANDNIDINVDTVDGTIRLFLNERVPPAKINLLIALYGLYFVLEDPKKTDIGSLADDEAETDEWRGGLVYNELCLKVMRENWTVKRVNPRAMGPYAFKDKQWVAYDDDLMIRNKAAYALEKNLGGIGFWTMDQDDFKGACHLQSYHLINAGREVFYGTPTSVSVEGGLLPLPTTSLPEETSPSSPESIPSFPTFEPQPDPPLLGPPTTFSQSLPSSVNRQNNRTPRPFVDSQLPDENNILNFNNGLNNRAGGTNKGTTIYQSNRDIIFQTFKLWITNYFYGNSQLPSKNI